MEMTKMKKEFSSIHAKLAIQYPNMNQEALMVNTFIVLIEALDDRINELEEKLDEQLEST